MGEVQGAGRSLWCGKKKRKEDEKESVTERIEPLHPSEKIVTDLTAMSITIGMGVWSKVKIYEVT